MEKKVLGVHHIAIHAKDFDKTVSLYETVFGFAPYLRWGEPGKRCIMLDTGDGTCIEIFEHGFLGEIEGSWCHLALRVTDTDTLYAAAIAAGCTEQIAPKDATLRGEFDLPVRLAFVKGLSGEIIELFQPMER